MIAGHPHAQREAQARFPVIEKSGGYGRPGPVASCLPRTICNTHAHAQPVAGSGVGQWYSLVGR